jgi:hypothetical protein
MPASCVDAEVVSGRSRSRRSFLRIAEAVGKALYRLANWCLGGELAAVAVRDFAGLCCLLPVPRAALQGQQILYLEFACMSFHPGLNRA